VFGERLLDVVRVVLSGAVVAGLTVPVVAARFARELVLLARACARVARPWVFVRLARLPVLLIRACVPVVFARAGAAE